jgi:serine/threonine protein kinase
MTQELRERANRVFVEAQGHPPEQRALFLDEACAGDFTLRGLVESLLEHDAAASREGFLAQPCPHNVRERAGDGGDRAERDVGEALSSAPSRRGSARGEPLPPNVPGYEVLEVLGRGGMGVVYKARQVHLKRVVALKMILSGEHASHENRLRFLTEAEAIAAIRHSNIVELYEFGTHGEAPFLVLEYCEGGSLAGKLAGTALPPREAAATLDQLGRAIQAAHDQGIIHRDLKPANVLLSVVHRPLSDARNTEQHTTDDGGRTVPKITDFGLAKLVQGGSGLTRTGAVMGTPSYMAPEQALGKKDVGPAADVWALGAILYECLTGRPPFRAATMHDTILQVLSDDPVPPRKLNAAVPVDLETITLKCLHKEPARRYESAGALADDLKRWLNNETIKARRIGPLERAVKWVKRGPVVAGLLAAILVLLLGAGGLVSWQAQRMAALTQEKDDPEEHQREQSRDWALAQVDSLFDAVPQAVPAILTALEPYIDVIRPRLREEADKPAPAAATPQTLRRWRQHRARAGLALLPGEPERREALFAQMLEEGLDPAEMLLVRTALKPHAAGLTGELWRRAGAGDPSSRFRALVALADYDPNSPRWPTTTAQLLAEMLSSGARDLGHWVQALRPIQAHLLLPLTRVFRGEDKELAKYRLAAASVLADYAGDRPQMLADLLFDADEKQYEVLRPAVMKHVEPVAARMERELTARPVDWQDAPLNPAWKTPAAELRREIEQAGGILAERYALCQSLPLERLRVLTEGLRASGYRPVRVRPWASERTDKKEIRRTHVAIIWTRDGQDWAMESGLPLDEVNEQLNSLPRAGVALTDLAGYVTK